MNVARTAALTAGLVAAVLATGALVAWLVIR